MIKKEVSEIKKQLTPANCALTRICCCYVDNEKQQRMTMKEAFAPLPEEEAFKYFEILKKVLSGKIGKNLINLAFPLEEEKSGTCHPLLMGLRDTELSDDDLLNEFYEKIVGNYVISDGCGYLILLVHGRYDIPGKASDGTDMFDASDEVYNFILGAICPFKLSKPGLSYSPDKNRIENNDRDMMVELPLHGFLFPAFNDRTSDIHEMLYYTKAAEGAQEDFVKSVFGCSLPMTPGEQRDAFQLICDELYGGNMEFEVAKAINGNLSDLLEERSYSTDGDGISMYELKTVLEKSGVEEEKLEEFDKVYARTLKQDQTLSISNIIDADKFQIDTEDIVIRTKPEYARAVKTRIIDGRPCIVIETEGNVTINGMEARVIAKAEK